MEIAQTYSYRHAEAIIEKEFAAEWQEILDVISAVQWVPMAIPRERRRHGRVVAILTIDQIQTNQRFEHQFDSRGWELHPRIVSRAQSQLAADFKKGPIQVEVQLGNMARWYTDVFKFLLSYAADDIEVGVLIVPMQEVSKQIDENVVYYERVTRAKMAVTIPVWVVGLGE